MSDGRLDAEGDPSWVTPDALEHLDRIIEAAIEPDLLRAYWAAFTLAVVHHLICNDFLGERIDKAISLGERRLAR